MVTYVWENDPHIKAAMAVYEQRRMSVKLLIDAQEDMLLKWASASSKRREELWRNLHKATDDVREVWGKELL